MKKRYQCVLVVVLSLFSLVTSASADMAVPKAKQTDLGLYVTAREAYAQWQASPEKVHLLDVRTLGEYVFVGHAPMAVHIPLKFLKAEIGTLTNKPVLVKNEQFVDEIKKAFDATDTILVMCRSGSRSAAAVNLMAKAGYKNVYNIIDGFEGDSLKVPDSYNNGRRLVNGWINSGAPWTYKLDPKLAYAR